jgi:hypothetical protein
MLAKTSGYLLGGEIIGALVQGVLVSFAYKTMKIQKESKLFITNTEMLYGDSKVWLSIAIFIIFALA